METKFGDNGWPVGTICELIRSDKVEYLYEMCEIIGPKKWNKEFQCFTYDIDIFKKGVKVYVADTQLKWNNFPTKWDNWLDMKITRLLQCDPMIAYQLGEELRREAKK